MGIVRILEGVPQTGTHRLEIAGDIVGLPVELLEYGNKHAGGVQITVEVNPIRLSFGTDPDNGVEPVGDLLEPGDVYQMRMGWGSLRLVKMLQAEAGKVGVVQITALF